MTAEIPDLECVESFLNQYEGGEIFISKTYWEEGIALLCIKHPEKRNAISGKMLTDLRKCVLELEKWDTGKAVILYGEGDVFCSGGDLDFARKENNPSAGLKMSSYMHDTLKKFRKLPLISVAMVRGVAIGGGAELVTFCDYILVCENTKLGFVHGKMGLIPAWGGGTRLVQILGQRKALQVVLSSKIYNSQECLDLGLAYKIVNTDDGLNEAVIFVRELISYDSSIVRSFKAVTVAAVRKSFEDSLDFEMNEFYPKWGASLNKESLSRNIKHVKNT